MLRSALCLLLLLLMTAVEGFYLTGQTTWEKGVPIHNDPDRKSQVPDPVMPEYNLSRTVESARWTEPPVPDHLGSLQELADLGRIGAHNFSCLKGTDHPGDGGNPLFAIAESELDEAMGNATVKPWANYLPGTTYWHNEFFHVGHVWYEIGIIEAFRYARFDRIVSQRGACHNPKESLCKGIGTIESFYKGFFAAVFRASGHPPIPIYIRYHGADHDVSAEVFSADAPGYTLNEGEHPLISDKLHLHPWTCYERVVRRVDVKFASVPVVSPLGVHNFKTAAYGMINEHQHQPHNTVKRSLSTCYRSWENKRPVILLSHRGKDAFRYINNTDGFADRLRDAFPSSKYDVRMLQNSNSSMTFEDQVRHVSEPHVVITNHGAFEANMIWMRKGALLLEIFGTYPLPEVHSFHRTALMFGLYYARYEVSGLTDHHSHDAFALKDAEMIALVDIVKEYFVREAWQHNSCSDDDEGLGMTEEFKK